MFPKESYALTYMVKLYALRRVDGDPHTINDWLIISLENIKAFTQYDNMIDFRKYVCHASLDDKIFFVIIK